MKTLYTNVRVIDCTGDDPFAGEVLIENAADCRGRPRAAADSLRRLRRHRRQRRDADARPDRVTRASSINNAATLEEIGMIPPEETTLLRCTTPGCTSIAASPVASARRRPSRELTS